MRGLLTAPRLSTLILFLLLIAICAYWALQILAPRPAIAPSASIGDAAAAASLAPAALLFGSQKAQAAGTPAAVSNIQVSGVAEAGPDGVVILSVDGKPGAAYGVDDSVVDGTTVKSVAIDKVVLEQRGRLIELKTPDRASLDILSSGVGKPRVGGNGSAVAPVPTRAVAPAPLQPGSTPAQPRFQAPQPPQQQQIQQQQIQEQQLQQQQLQQQQLQQQQAQQLQQSQSQGQQLPQGQGQGEMQVPPAGEPQPGQEQQPSEDPQNSGPPGQVQGSLAPDPPSGGAQPTKGVRPGNSPSTGAVLRDRYQVPARQARAGAAVAAP